MNSAVKWAKHRNQEVEIDEKWIEERFCIQNNKCYWFNTPFEMVFSGRHPLKPSLDRLDRLKGYTKENTVIASYAANFGRNETMSRYHTFCTAEQKGL